MGREGDVRALLDQCIALERAAAAVYEILARRFAHDGELVALWAALARDEHDHARRLAACRDALAGEPGERAPAAKGLEETIADVRWLLTQSRIDAETADEEEAFAIALAMENSELDVVFTTLLQSALRGHVEPVTDGMRPDAAAHYGKLLAMAQRRCRAEKTMRRAALLAEHHR
jgi:rubrerythrin